MLHAATALGLGFAIIATAVCMVIGTCWPNYNLFSSFNVDVEKRRWLQMDGKSGPLDERMTTVAAEVAAGFKSRPFVRLGCASGRWADFTAAIAALGERPYELANDDNDLATHCEWRIGWPSRALRIVAKTGRDQLPPVQCLIFLATPSEDTVLYRNGGQVHVMWRGLLVNSLLFFMAGVSCGLVTCGLRAMIRRVGSRCCHCGFILNGSTGCPECGWNRPEGEGRDPSSDVSPTRVDSADSSSSSADDA